MLCGRNVSHVTSQSVKTQDNAMICCYNLESYIKFVIPDAMQKSFPARRASSQRVYLWRFTREQGGYVATVVKKPNGELSVGQCRFRIATLRAIAGA